MSQIFISYAREDRPHAERLARAMEQRGWTVWWDRTIPAGRNYDEVIEQALHAAQCVVVLWSEHSAKSHWVSAEAQEGADRNILVPIVIQEGVKIPIGFRRLQAASLVGWDGRPTDPAFVQLADDVAHLVGPRQTPSRPESMAPRAAPPRGALRSRLLVAGGIVVALAVAAVYVFGSSGAPSFPPRMAGSCGLAIGNQSERAPVMILPRQEGSEYVLGLLMDSDTIDLRVIPSQKSYQMFLPPDDDDDVDSIRVFAFTSDSVDFTIYSSPEATPGAINCVFTT